MEAMGLVESLQLYSSKKKLYKLSSPIMEAFLADRYGFEDRDVSFEEAMPAIIKLRNLAVQNFIADLFASTYKGKKEYYLKPSNEMDFIITVRNKAVLAGEVKWGKYDTGDVEKFIEKSNFIQAEKIFITKNKRESRIGNVRIIDAYDIQRQFHIASDTLQS